MRVAPEALVEPAHLLVHHGVAGDTIVEVGLLRGGRQLAVEQEIAGLEEIAVLGQLLDRKSAIEQDAFVAVDIGDLGFAAAGRGVAGVVGEHPGLSVELADVDDRGADRSLVDRERVFLVSNDELAGLDVGAGLRIHDRALGVVSPAKSALRGLRHCSVRNSGKPAGEAAFWVAETSVRCKMAAADAPMRRRGRRSLLASGSRRFRRTTVSERRR